MSEIRIIETSDGSQSLFLKDMNETYHSTHGALTESQYVFIEKGLQFWFDSNKQDSLKILEVGFGTGLNALLTLAFVKSHEKVEIDYQTLEPYPLPQSVYSKLKYAELIDSADTATLIEMHQSPFGEQLDYEHFTFKKHKEQVQDFEGEGFDLIYFDAFAPSKQKEVWDLKIFQSLFSQLNQNGVLVTYCAQGQFKRDLVTAGFDIETLDGPPGKKEMVRGVKRV